MFKIFIQRPILSLVISLLILLLGVLSMFTLPVTQFPDIAPPCVTVTAKYTGANAEVCTKAVATPLERAINGVPGMTYMSSVTSNNGITLIQVYFNTGIDPDLAAVNVQNRVNTVIDELPEEVIKAGITTEKEVNSMLLYLNVFSNDTTVGEKFIYNFADINILQELKRIDGVGFCELLGSREYSMRVWLKPDRMAVYDISPEDVIEAIRSQNLEAAPGKIGENSGKHNQHLQYVLKYTGKYFKPDQYKNIILKSEADGSVLRLKDIAEVEFGVMDYSMISSTDGKPSASIMVKQRPGSNAKEVIENVKNKINELKKEGFPPGMDYNISYDISQSLDASMHEVIKTLIEALILVFIVVLIFLQDFRSTLIPALAVPVSLIGTFFFMQLAGFSINLLTLFALVLAIGIVVDNAIVVVEAVHATMALRKIPAKEATMLVMRDMSKAIISITLVMSAVFLPVAFMSGPAGIFYKQFSITLAIAIVISGVNALTLTPALCAMWLKNTHSSHNPWASRFFNAFNKNYSKVENRYLLYIKKIIPLRLFTIGSVAFLFIATYGISVTLPTGFIPQEDQGQVYITVTCPNGATVERTAKVLQKISSEAKKLEPVSTVSTLAGYSFITEAAGSSFGMGMINLKHWDDRKQSAVEIIEILKKNTASIKDAEIDFFAPPTVPGFGNAGGFEMKLLDKTKGNDLSNSAKVIESFIKETKKEPAIGSAFSSFDISFPQYLIHFDQDKASQKGVTAEIAMNSLQTYLGSFYASNFIRFGQMYKVMVQADPIYRRQPDDVTKLFVKNKEGSMIPVSSFIRLERVYGPEQLTRHNMYTAAMITGSPAKNYSSGDAIKAIEKVAAEKLPRGYEIEWSGMTREEILSGNQAIYIFLLCLLFVYLLLAAQYESLLLPLVVILSLPAGVLGAFLGLKLAGLENNIYGQVALVMLIGLLGKNAILIVEYANQRLNEGATFIDAAIEGSVSRLRPILMTSFAFVAGLIPLCIASGAGATGSRSIGMSGAAGMLFGTIAGVLLIPGLFYLFASLENKLRKKSTEDTTELKMSLTGQEIELDEK